MARGVGQMPVTVLRLVWGSIPSFGIACCPGRSGSTASRIPLTRRPRPACSSYAITPDSDRREPTSPAPNDTSASPRRARSACSARVLLLGAGASTRDRRGAEAREHPAGGRGRLKDSNGCRSCRGKSVVKGEALPRPPVAEPEPRNAHAQPTCTRHTRCDVRGWFHRDGHTRLRTGL